jgi:hypothetical protein
MSIYRYGIFENGSEEDYFFIEIKKGSFFEEIKTFPCTIEGKSKMISEVKELEKDKKNKVFKR